MARKAPKTASSMTNWAVGLTVASVGAAWLAFRLAGFIGVGVLGLFITFVAVRVDLEKDAVVGFNTPDILTQQAIMREKMTRAERAAHRAEGEALKMPLRAARTVGIALIVVGFGAFFFMRP